MKKVLCTVLALATLFTTSCSALGGLGSGASAPGAALASEKERVSPDVPEADVRELVEGNSAFAFDLYRRLAEQEDDKTLFCSPYSISLALVMAYAGARGETEEQMAAALRFMLPQDRLHPAFNALDRELTQRGEEEDQEDEEDAEGFRLRIVNAIWGQEGGEFLDAFLDTLAVSYGAGLRLLDFAGAPEQARAKINAWVSQQTEGKIKNLIGPLNPPPRLILTNAIYFKAAWDKPFEERATRERPFTRLDGSEVTVPMMHQTNSFRYAEGEGYQAVKLRYEGRPMSMVILLPERGLSNPSRRP